MSWEVEYTEDFSKWWHNLNEEETISIDACIRLLEQLGPQLKFPYSSGIEGTKYTHMRELRIQHKGKPFRILYAFDPRRIAILLIGGSKEGNDRWYRTFIPIAEKLYQQHLNTLKEENYDKIL